MIKVNLLKNRGAGVAGEATYSITVEGGAEGQREAAVKILMMCFFPVLLVIYENYNIGQLKEESIRLSAEINKYNQTIKKKKDSAGSIDEIKNVSKALEDKMKIMKDLSKTRLRELKALDFLQSMMPERVWLKNLEYSNGKFSIKGLAISDDDLAELVQGLDKSFYFNDVILLQATEIETPGGALKSFEISCVLGEIS